MANLPSAFPFTLALFHKNAFLLKKRKFYPKEIDTRINLRENTCMDLTGIEKNGMITIWKT